MIAFTHSEAKTVQAALSIINKKLQEEEGVAVSTATPARKGRADSKVDKVLEARRNRFRGRK